MPDQDFNIKVVTTADTSGLQRTDAAIKRIQVSAETLAARQASLRSQLTAVPAGLTGGVVPEAQVPVDIAKTEAGALAQRAIGRFTSSIVRSFVGLAAVELVARKITEWAENILKAAESQRELNREIDKAVKGYEDIHNLAGWDKANDAIEEQIQKLRDKKAIETHPDAIKAIDKEIAARERQQQDLAIQTQRGYERAQAEEKVRIAIREQVDALADADKASNTSVDTAKANREEAEKNLANVQATEAAQIKARSDAAQYSQGIKDADEKALAAKKELEKLEAQASEGARVNVEEARKKYDLAQKEATETRRLASEAAKYVLQLDKGKDALRDQLAQTKAIADERRREEREAKVNEAQRQQEAYGAASPQAKAILENEKRARETGDQAFQKTADQLRASATSKDLADIQKVTDSYLKAPRPGRAAGVGESQDLVDQIERNRIAVENAQKPTAQPQVESGTGQGGPGLVNTGQGWQDIKQAIEDLKTAHQQQTDWQKTVWGN